MLGRAQQEGGLVISAPVYVELRAHPATTIDFTREFLAQTGIDVDWSIEEAIWHEAARGFAAYADRRRRSGAGTPKRLVVDFLIGAHALLLSDRLLTLDSSRYMQDFPSLQLMS